MPDTKSFWAEELSNFFEATWLELPAEAAKALSGASDADRLRKMGWKAYDSWVRLANEITNTVYSDPIVGEASGRMMETALRFRQITGTMASAFFANLWPSIGLPTHKEMGALRDELLALREELASYARPVVAEPGAEVDARDKLSLWKRPQLNGYRAENANSIRRSANQGKRNAAA
jgi:hypothetical protein